MDPYSKMLPALELLFLCGRAVLRFAAVSLHFLLCNMMVSLLYPCYGFSMFF